MDFYMAKLEWLQSHREGEFVTTRYRMSSTMRYAAAAASLKELYQRVTRNEWVKGGNGEFDPTKRIWHAGYEQPLLSPANGQTEEAPNEEEEQQEDGIEGSEQTGVTT
jgi:hypothetical protein